MLWRQSHHISLPALLFSFNFLRTASSSRSNPNPNPKTLTQLHNKISKSTSSTDPLLTGGDRRNISSANPSDPTSSSILSLLSEPSDLPLDLDFLLQNFKNKLTSDLVLRILRNYKQIGRSRTLGFFSWAGFQLDFRFDDAVVEYMADFLGRRKLFDDLKCLLKTAASRNRRVSARSVAISIRFLGRNGRIMEAFSLFKSMESELFCVPDNLVFNNMLYVLCRMDPNGNFFDAALLIFRRIGKPDEFTYSNVLIGLSRFGRFENAVQVFYEMSRAHLILTRTAANILISEMCRSGGQKKLIEKVKVRSFHKPFEILVPCVGSKGYIDSAVEIFWAILDMDLVPSGHVINVLITELCQLQKLEEAIEILKMVGNKKLNCGDESYIIVIQELYKAYRTNEACGLFEKMISQGFNPKVAGLNSLIEVLCKVGNVEEAKKYFDHMKKMKRCEPNRSTYALLIHAYGEVENWEAAYELVMEMMDLGWDPQFDLYGLLVCYLRENGRDDMLLKMERKKEVLMLYSYCRDGRVAAACEKLKGMMAEGICLPIYVRDAFERAFRKAGRWKMASQILSEMDRIAIQKNV